MKRVAVGALLFCTNAWAIPEADFAKIYSEKVLPFVETTMHAGSMKTPDQLNIRYAIFENQASGAAIVISPGRTESYLKYFELAYDLYSRGFSVYIIDHRGQGLSDRLLRDPEIGYVDRFSDYVGDFEQFMSTVVKPAHHSKLFLLAHSMGSPIAMAYLDRHRGDFGAAVFSSPMLRLVTKPYPEPVAFEIAYWLTAAGRGGQYAPGQKPYDPNEPFEKSDVTHSRARWLVNHEAIASNPAITLGGVSSRWVLESMKAIAKIRSAAPNIALPMLIFEAGEDTIVKTSEESHFCQTAPDCRAIAFEHARHEIFNETDDVRDQALAEAVELFSH